jgi:hypothetical protein
MGLRPCRTVTNPNSRLISAVKESQYDRLAILRWRALRFFQYVCYDKSRNDRTDFYWQFMGSSSRKDCYCVQSRRTVRCMRILQSQCLQGFTLVVDSTVGDVVQLVRTLPCHGRGREFESRRPRHS